MTPDELIAIIESRNAMIDRLRLALYSLHPEAMGGCVDPECVVCAVLMEGYGK